MRSLTPLAGTLQPRGSHSGPQCRRRNVRSGPVRSNRCACAPLVGRGRGGGRPHSLRTLAAPRCRVLCRAVRMQPNGSSATGDHVSRNHRSGVHAAQIEATHRPEHDAWSVQCLSCAARSLPQPRAVSCCVGACCVRCRRRCERQRRFNCAANVAVPSPVLVQMWLCRAHPLRLWPSRVF